MQDDQEPRRLIISKHAAIRYMERVQTQSIPLKEAKKQIWQLWQTDKELVHKQMRDGEDYRIYHGQKPYPGNQAWAVFITLNKPKHDVLLTVITSTMWADQRHYWENWGRRKNGSHRRRKKFRKNRP